MSKVINNLLTPKQVAELLNISTRTVYENKKRLGGFYPAGIQVLRFHPGVINGIMERQNEGELAVQLPIQGQDLCCGRIPDQGRGPVHQGGTTQANQYCSDSGDSNRQGFLEICNLYLDWSKRRHVKKTYSYKEMVFRKFLEFHGNLFIKDITPQHIHEFLNTRQTNNNYNKCRKEISALFAFARQKLKVINHNPCWDIEKMPVKRSEKLIPTQEEILRLIMACDQEERPLILVLIHTLARIDEILRLTWQDINFEHRTIRLWTRKRKDGSWDYDVLPMNEDLKSILWELWQKRKQDQWVFFNKKTSTRYFARPKLMRRLCTRAGISQFRFHAIRHFTASYLADQEKVSKKAISGLLRHKSLGTTEIYLHSVDESQRQAMRRLEGQFLLAGDACGFDEKAPKKAASSANDDLETPVNKAL